MKVVSLFKLQDAFDYYTENNMWWFERWGLYQLNAQVSQFRTFLESIRNTSDLNEEQMIELLKIIQDLKKNVKNEDNYLNIFLHAIAFAFQGNLDPLLYLEEQGLLTPTTLSDWHSNDWSGHPGSQVLNALGRKKLLSADLLKMKFTREKLQELSTAVLHLEAFEILTDKNLKFLLKHGSKSFNDMAVALVNLTKITRCESLIDLLAQLPYPRRFTQACLYLQETAVGDYYLNDQLYKEAISLLQELSDPVKEAKLYIFLLKAGIFSIDKCKAMRSGFAQIIQLETLENLASKGLLDAKYFPLILSSPYPDDFADALFRLAKIPAVNAENVTYIYTSRKPLEAFEVLHSLARTPAMSDDLRKSVKTHDQASTIAVIADCLTMYGCYENSFIEKLLVSKETVPFYHGLLTLKSADILNKKTFGYLFASKEPLQTSHAIVALHRDKDRLFDDDTMSLITAAERPEELATGLIAIGHNHLLRPAVTQAIKDALIFFRDAPTSAATPPPAPAPAREPISARV